MSDTNEDIYGGEMEEGEANDAARRKKKSKKKLRLMSASGQTEQDRRILRRKQRELHQDIAIGNSGAAAVGDGEELTHLRNQNNELWDEVRYPREAVLDSENVGLIASKAARQAEKIVEVPRYDAVRLAQSFAKKGSVRTGSTTQFNWRGFGLQVGLCFNALPEHCSFLYGPLDAEYTPKERKKPERRKKQTQEELSDGDEEEPDTVNQTGKNKNSDGNELSAVARHMKVISKTLHQRAEEQHDLAIEKADEYEKEISQEIDDHTEVRRKKKAFVEQNSQVCAVNCLFNPKSFTQTVENFFHYSFLVNKTKAGIRNRTVKEAEEFGGMPGPVIVPKNDTGDKIPPKQAIVALSMKDWRDMCKAYNVEKSDVPHRQESMVSKFDKSSNRKSHVFSNNDAKRAARETAAAGAGTTSLPHPSVVTQTDDVEMPGGIDNDGGRSGDLCRDFDRNRLARKPNGSHMDTMQRFAAAADAHQRENENSGDEERKMGEKDGGGESRFGGQDDDNYVPTGQRKGPPEVLVRAISQSQHEPSSDIHNNRKRGGINNNRKRKAKRSRKRNRMSPSRNGRVEKSCLENLNFVDLCGDDDSD